MILRQLGNVTSNWDRKASFFLPPGPLKRKARTWNRSTMGYYLMTGKTSFINVDITWIFTFLSQINEDAGSGACEPMDQRVPGLSLIHI